MVVLAGVGLSSWGVGVKVAALLVLDRCVISCVFYFVVGWYNITSWTSGLVLLFGGEFGFWVWCD